MERMQGLSDQHVQELRTEQQGYYPDKSEPLPGTPLKLDDDVMWADCIPMRVIWGYDDPTFYQGYTPELTEGTVTIEGIYITDRAPVDPSETPMPLYPPEVTTAKVQQQQQPQAKDKSGLLRAIQHLMQQLDPRGKQRLRALLRASKHAELADL